MKPRSWPLRAVVMEEGGQTLIEYGLMLTLLAMAVVATLSLVGGSVTDLFATVSSDFRNAATP